MEWPTHPVNQNAPMGGFYSFWNKRMQLFAINPDLMRKASGLPGRRPLILFYGFSFGG